MKRTYIKPTITRVDIDKTGILAASVEEPNAVRYNGERTFIGGYSQESLNEDNDGDGTVDDMAKGNNALVW